VPPGAMQLKNGIAIVRFYPECSIDCAIAANKRLLESVYNRARYESEKFSAKSNFESECARSPKLQDISGHLLSDSPSECG
jgi:hypothetical protein